MAVYEGVTFVGREPEKGVLAAAMASDEAELVAVYGRRRVGKTFLVREVLGADICFELTGVHRAPLDEQLGNFKAAFGAARGRQVDVPSSWQEAFHELAAWIESLPKRKRKRVLFFDELPWLASRRSAFLRAFEHFWNARISRRNDLVVVVCGSAASWMIQKLLKARGGLHNRVTRRIRLEPFTLGETRAFLDARSIALDPYSVAELYMAMGGIPHYLKEVRRGASVAQNIDRICFASEGLLRDEFGHLYASLFEHSERHEAVVRTLAASRGGLKRTELLRRAGLESGGSGTTLLMELEESGFIAKRASFGFKSKEAVYFLNDEYSLFYLQWIQHHQGRGKNRWATRRSSPSWRAWSGFAFEAVCAKHVDELKSALGIGAVETVESTWRYVAPTPDERGAQIDLLIDRRDHCINLCEMKFSEAPFVIDKRYADELRHKAQTFRRVTQTNKTLFITLVTANGVFANRYRDELVDAAVELPSLFLRA